MFQHLRVNYLYQDQPQSEIHSVLTSFSVSPAYVRQAAESRSNNMVLYYYAWWSRHTLTNIPLLLALLWQSLLLRYFDMHAHTVTEEMCIYWPQFSLANIGLFYSYTFAHTDLFPKHTYLAAIHIYITSWFCSLRCFWSTCMLRHTSSSRTQVCDCMQLTCPCALFRKGTDPLILCLSATRG
jgi:hypothetical protein